MARLKPILPTLRERKRYLAFQILSKTEIKDFLVVSDAIKASMASLFGQTGLAKAGIIPLNKKYNAEKQIGMVRVNHQHVHDLKSAMCFVTQIGRTDVTLKSLGVSGILKKAEKRYLAS